MAAGVAKGKLLKQLARGGDGLTGLKAGANETRLERNRLTKPDTS